MLKNISKNVMEGLARIKWFFSIVAERVKIEIAVIRLLGRSEHYENERKRLLESIGERVADLREGGPVNIYDDPLVMEHLRKLVKLEEEISSLRDEAREISAVEV